MSLIKQRLLLLAFKKNSVFSKTKFFLPARLRRVRTLRPVGGTRSILMGRTARAPVLGRLRYASGAAARARPRVPGCRARAELELWYLGAEKSKIRVQEISKTFGAVTTK